jgi:hypothetical protein
MLAAHRPLRSHSQLALLYLPDTRELHLTATPCSTTNHQQVLRGTRRDDGCITPELQSSPPKWHATTRGEALRYGSLHSLDGALVCGGGGGTSSVLFAQLVQAMCVHLCTQEAIPPHTGPQQQAGAGHDGEVHVEPLAQREARAHTHTNAHKRTQTHTWKRKRSPPTSMRQLFSNRRCCRRRSCTCRLTSATELPRRRGEGHIDGGGSPGADPRCLTKSVLRFEHHQDTKANRDTRPPRLGYGGAGEGRSAYVAGLHEAVVD